MKDFPKQILGLKNKLVMTRTTFKIHANR